MRRNKAIIVGITGGFGTGKSATAKAFKTLGAKVVDADKIAHEALKKGTPSYRKAARVFGRSILDNSGRISRTKLANLVFRDKKALKKLCDIIHPSVIEKIKKSIKVMSSSGNARLIVIDAPLLIETGLDKLTDCLLVVKTSKATQAKRAMRKTGLSRKDVMRRIKSQMPLSEKIKIADYVINNEGSKHDITKTVKKTWEGIKSGGK